MSKETKGGATQINTNYTRTTGSQCVIRRLSSSPNKFGSYTYALISGELPEGTKTYGKEGRVVFYSNKLVGALDTDYTASIATVDYTNETTGEVTKQPIIMRSEAEVKKQEELDRNAQQDAKMARAYGLTKQDVGKIVLQELIKKRMGSTTVEQLESAEA